MRQVQHSLSYLKAAFCLSLPPNGYSLNLFDCSRSVTREGKAVLEPCKENAEGALKCSAHDIVKQGRSHEAVTPCLTTQMVRDALQVIKPSPQPSMEYYQAWTKLYGSSGK